MIKILIPTDFSFNSCQAISYITKFFKNEACAFYFFNIYFFEICSLEAISLLHADDDWFDKPKENSLAQLDMLLENENIIQNNVLHEYYLISENYNLVKGISEKIEVLGIDLLVLGVKNKIGKKISEIICKIRSCTIMIIPPSAIVCRTFKFTIVSNSIVEKSFFEIDKFLNVFKNTSFQVTILVLEEKNNDISEVNNNLNLLVKHLENYLRKTFEIEYLVMTTNLNDHGILHLNSILCLLDKKPNLLERIGVNKSKILSTLGKVINHPVLILH